MSIPAINLQLKGKRLGLVGILIFFQLFFFLETVVQSPIIPGNWTAYQLPMEFYLILTAVGMFLLGYGTKPLSIQKGGIGEFMLMFSVFGAAAWLLVAVLDHGGAALSGIDRIQLFVFVLIFVAPSEELVFRVALPPYVGWLIGSGIMFGIFHIFAYSVAGPSGPILIIQLVEAMILGVLFYFIYQRWGYGAAVGVHAGYDLAVLGVLGTGLALGLAFI